MKSCGASLIANAHPSADAHVAATQAIDDAIKRCLNLVRKLDVIVRNKFRNDAGTLAAWTSASHVERPPQRKTAPTKQPTQPAK